MRSAFSRALAWLDTLPLWVLLVGAAAAGIFAFFDMRFPTPLYAPDRFLALLLAGAAAWYVWRRLFQGPTTPGAREVRARIREIQRLSERLEQTARKTGSATVQSQVSSMSGLVARARDVAQRLLALEVILRRPEYGEKRARTVIQRLESEIGAASPDARHELEAALADARAHLENLAAIRGHSETMRASLERVRQLYQRAESQLVVGTLSDDAGGRDLAATVEELTSVLSDLEHAREEVAEAAREVAAAEQKAKKAAAGHSR